ncbi:prolipoprotein diacylglyceryl transferase 2 [Streptomyces spiroverticillatus]
MDLACLPAHRPGCGTWARCRGAYAFCIILGVFLAAGWATGAGSHGAASRASSRTSPSGQCSGLADGLPRTRRPDAYFGDRGEPIGALYMSEGGLGVWVPSPWAAWARGSLPPPPHPLPRLRGHRRPGHRAGPGDRPLRQLVQPGTLRPPHHSPPGPGNRPHTPPARPARHRDLPPHLPLRGPLEPRRRRTRPLGGKRGSRSATAGPSPCTSRAYAVGRFWTEYLRIDESHTFLGLRLNNWTSALVFLGAVRLPRRTRPAATPASRTWRSPSTRAEPGEATSLVTP